MFALKLDVRACTRLLSVAAAALRSPLLELASAAGCGGLFTIARKC